MAVHITSANPNWELMPRMKSMEKKRKDQRAGNGIRLIAYKKDKN
jgi:hypothetical protein